MCHRTLAEQLSRLPEIHRLHAGDRVLSVTPYGYASAVRDLFWPLVAGATVVLAARGGHRDARYLHRLATHDEVTVLHLPPATLAAVLRRGPRPPEGLRRVCVTGDTVPAATVEAFHAAWPGVELYDVWGSAETGAALAGRCEPGSGVAIGRPLSNRAAYILDEHLRPVPIGMTGHLYIGGAGLATGYPGRAGATAARFVPDPHRPGGRMVATGDLARRRGDGVVEHLGRADRHVTVRGQRVELDRVEAVLAGHPAVRRCAVTLHRRPR